MSKKNKSTFKEMYEKQAKEMLYNPQKIRELVEETAEQVKALRDAEKKNAALNKYINKSYKQMIDDLGGELHVSFIESELARRMANLSLIANNMETTMLYEPEQFDFDRYIVLVRTFIRYTINQNSILAFSGNFVVPSGSLGPVY